MLSSEQLLDICKRAGDLFLHAELPLNGDGDSQTADQYISTLSQTSGLPHVLVRRNMQKIFTVFDGMHGILNGLMRGMDAGVVETGFGSFAEFDQVIRTTFVAQLKHGFGKAAWQRSKSHASFALTLTTMQSRAAAKIQALARGRAFRRSLTEPGTIEAKAPPAAAPAPHPKTGDDRIHPHLRRISGELSV